jgi:hypothetical protein
MVMIGCVYTLVPNFYWARTSISESLYARMVINVVWQIYVVIVTKRGIIDGFRQLLQAM